MKRFAILTFALLAFTLIGCHPDRETHTAADEHEAKKGSGGDARPARVADDVETRRTFEGNLREKMVVLDARLNVMESKTLSAPETLDAKVAVLEAATKRKEVVDRLAELEAATNENWPVVRPVAIAAMTNYEDSIRVAEARFSTSPIR